MLNLLNQVVIASLLNKHKVLARHLKLGLRSSVGLEKKCESQRPLVATFFSNGFQ